MLKEYFEHLRLLNDFRNSMLYWYPRVKDVAPTPETRWVEVEPDVVWYDNVPESVVEEVKRIADEIGYPVFMRSDVNSGKHRWVETCYVKSPEQIERNLNMLVEDHVVKDLILRAIVLREFVELDWKFKAFYGKLPIATEVRVMVKDGEVERWFFYWPEKAIMMPDRVNWRSLLVEMRKTAEKEQDEFIKLAEKVARKFEGYWSVDFARTKEGRWILIDMALGEVSWRPELTED